MSIDSANNIDDGVMDLALDADSHEMAPVHLWPEIFGAEIEQYVAVFHGMELLRIAGENAMVRDDIVGDRTPVSHETVWNLKGPEAPSAIDLARRVEVIDAMGIDRQLVYPTMATMGYLFFTDPTVALYLGFDSGGLDVRQVGRHLIDIHNRWVGRVSGEQAGRVRPVAVVLEDTVDALIDEAERVLDDGARAVMIPAGLPPGGVSPADRRLDPFWRLLADANVPVLHHVSVERGFLQTAVWASNVPEFARADTSTAEFHIEPWRCATLAFACESFLAAMVLGGVFERHPGLRFGIAEFTAGWVGPFGERLDDVVAQFPSRYKDYEMRPSERLARNVRVVPFPFEPIGRYIEAHNWMADILCYGSDFPHKEGGRESKKTFHELLDPFGDDLLRKFFRTNAELLLPA